MVTRGREGEGGGGWGEAGGGRGREERQLCSHLLQHYLCMLCSVGQGLPPHQVEGEGSQTAGLCCGKPQDGREGGRASLHAGGLHMDRQAGRQAGRQVEAWHTSSCFF